MSNVELIPIMGEHAEELYPMVYQTKITDTIQWDGPDTLEDFIEGLKLREQQFRRGEINFFTIRNKDSKELMGVIDIRPATGGRHANIGLWVGEKFHGKGVGTQAVKLITKYGFETLGFKRIEGYVFVGNMASRRIFEKSGYHFGGLADKKVIKRGREVEEWLLYIEK